MFVFNFLQLRFSECIFVRKFIDPNIDQIKEEIKVVDKLNKENSTNNLLIFHLLFIDFCHLEIIFNVLDSVLIWTDLTFNLSIKQIL